MQTRGSSETLVSSYLILRYRLLEDLQSNLKCVGEIRNNLICHRTTNTTDVFRHSDQKTHRRVSPPI